MKQRTTVSEIQIDLKLNGKLNILSDQMIKEIDIEHINPDKQNVIDKAKSSIETQWAANKSSTPFRSQLLKKSPFLLSGNKDLHVFTSQPQYFEAQVKIPSQPRLPADDAVFGPPK